MYKVEPYYNFEIDRQQPECMYKMKNLLEPTNMSLQEPASNLAVQLATLEQHQEAILKRLHVLKDELKRINEDSVSSSERDISGADVSRSNLGIVVHDLVISASPDSAPLSLLVLKELLSQHYSVMSSCHVHSSAGTVSTMKRQFLGKKMDVYNRDNYQLAITLIWKKVLHGPTLVTSPNLHTAIHGEMNIARYLGRLLVPAYDEGDPAVATMIDQWIDTSQKITVNDQKQTASVFKNLESTLGKNDWLVGGQLSLADVVMWSTIRQTGLSTDVAVSVKKWLERCDKIAAFQDAVKFITM